MALSGKSFTFWSNYERKVLVMVMCFIFVCCDVL